MIKIRPLTERATIRMTDVAELAGVSVATVSRALTASGPVSADARLKIEKALKQTGYTINNAARSLRRKEARAIIVIVPDISQPFFSLILRGIEEKALAIGYSVLIGNSAHDPRREALYAQDVITGRADGVILINGRMPKYGTSDISSFAPIVVVSERIGGIDLPLVAVDNAEAAEAAVRHLLELGHRRIGHIAGSKKNTMTTERLNGYRRALRRHGITHDPELIGYGDYSIVSGASAVRGLLGLSEPPTAIFAGNDDMAIGAINESKAMGWRVPDDLSVVGFDDVPFAASFDPPLTTIRQPFAEMGAQAMTALSQLLENRKLESEIPTFPTQLVVRKSTTERGQSQ